MRVLGFDFGMKHIGVAVGQSITKTATPLTVLKARDGVPAWSSVATLIEEWQPEALILGIPLNMDGTSQPLTFAAKSFGKKLKKHFPYPLFHVDERLSTWEAKQRMQESNNKQDKNDPKKINALAAVILVEQWFTENGI